MRTITLTLLLLSLLTHCAEYPEENQIRGISSDTQKLPIENSSAHIIGLSKTQASIIYSDTTIINGEAFISFSKADTLFITNEKGDTMVKKPGMTGSFEFEDFNRDGYNDIRIHYPSNVPAIQDLLLFDPANKTFRLVKDFWELPDPKPILGTKYYYSYHRSGCADFNWDSDLFYFENFNTVKIGNIAGNVCPNTKEKNGIYISRIINGKKVPLKRIPIEELQKNGKRKMGFIKEYWTTNYPKFL